MPSSPLRFQQHPYSTQKPTSYRKQRQKMMGKWRVSSCPFLAIVIVLHVLIMVMNGWKCSLLQYRKTGAGRVEASRAVGGGSVTPHRPHQQHRVSENEGGDDATPCVPRLSPLRWTVSPSRRANNTVTTTTALGFSKRPHRMLASVGAAEGSTRRPLQPASRFAIDWVLRRPRQLLPKQRPHLASQQQEDNKLPPDESAAHAPRRKRYTRAMVMDLYGQSRPLTTVTSVATLGAVVGSAVTVGRAVLWGEPVRRAAYFWWHVGPMVAHYKFCHWWLQRTTRRVQDRPRRDAIWERMHTHYAVKALQVMLHLKGLYIKLGQVMSSRPDFMPPQYVQELATVQDAVPQWPLSDVQKTIQESFQEELGLNYDDVFESMDADALGSASIGQVHRAVLTDAWVARMVAGGLSPPKKIVAVKVMHPGAKERFTHDFQVFRWFCRIALPQLLGFLAELERRMMTEFDYRSEAAALREVGDNLRQSPYRNQVCVPEPVDELSCRQVLVMEMLHGKKLNIALEEQLAQALGEDLTMAKALVAQRTQELLSGHADEANDSSGDIASRGKDSTDGIKSTWSILANASWLQKLRLLMLVVKCRQYVSLLVDVHGRQILVDGCFNGDPHFGNCLLLRDGRIGLIDYGQTRRLDDQERYGLARVINTVGTAGNNATAVAAQLRQVGFATQFPDDEMLATYGRLFFDSDSEAQLRGFATPQLYFSYLMAENPLTSIPDAAVFVCRVSFLFRGMGSVTGSGQIRTAHRWSKFAKQALQERKQYPP